MIFNLQSVKNDLKVDIKGVIHVGAFDGQELTSYRSLNLFNTILFEPQKVMYDIVKQKCIVDETVHNFALGADNFESEMFISDKAGGIANGASQSSSILEPSVHLTEHPDITFPTKETITVKRFDGFASDAGINMQNYNMLNIDVQGYELEVLKGFGDLLNHVELIIAEVNRDDVYKDCAQIEDIDEYLSKYSLDRASVYWQSTSWGDAIYVRK